MVKAHNKSVSTSSFIWLKGCRNVKFWVYVSNPSFLKCLSSHLTGMFLQKKSINQCDIMLPKNIAFVEIISILVYTYDREYLGSHYNSLVTRGCCTAV